MHIYYDEDHRPYPSVTTILHILGSDSLMKWANIMGFRRKRIEDLLEKSSSFGTMIHSQLRAIVDPGREEPISPKDVVETFDVTKILRTFQSYLSQFPYETIDTERQIISKELGYAGTMDWLCYMGTGSSKKLLLHDFKTSKAVHQTMLLQLGGYCNLLETQGFHIDGASILLVNGKGCSMHPISRETVVSYGKTFDLLYQFYQNASILRESEGRRFGIDYGLLDDLTT